jgi:hypothetical protein
VNYSSKIIQELELALLVFELISPLVRPLFFSSWLEPIVPILLVVVSGAAWYEQRLKVLASVALVVAAEVPYQSR